ncbi:MAG: mechanosensitive ion channel family protein, partial [Alphaproteobacteria bacterium]
MPLTDLWDPETWRSYVAQVMAWIDANIVDLAIANAGQLIVVGLAFVLARLIGPRIVGWAARLAQSHGTDGIALRAVVRLRPLVVPLTWLMLQGIAVFVAIRTGLPHGLLIGIQSLLGAWIVIRLASRLVHNEVLSRTVATLAWTIAALNIVGLLDEAVAFLDGLALQLGDLRLSVLVVIKGVVALVVLLWAASGLTRLAESRVRRATGMSPSMRVLIVKLTRMALFVVAVLVALSSVGIDLTAFAVFSGAVGVGIGFGLQKTVANLLSGVMLLLDRSIKPGDVIAVAGTYGWVTQLNSRYTSVVTRDGIEHLIPNEELIINRVENWSYSDSNIRLKIPIGIAYKSDVRKAMALCLEAAGEVARVVTEPESVCLLKGFGASSVDLELRISIVDPTNGITNVKSEVLLKIWDKFHAHGIEIPFPQRDVRLINPSLLPMAVDR